MSIVYRASLGFALAASADSQEDVGYELLYQTANDEFHNNCLSVTGEPFPEWAHGSWVVGSVGQQEMGERHFVGFLDSYGKYNKFSMKGDQVCATYRMLDSGFYNNSVKEGTIAAGFLFYETDPPRSCPVYNPLCNMLAPNDNTFVNTFKHNGDILSVTDAPFMLKLDPETLQVKGTMKWDDSIQSKTAFVGSAHPEMSPQFGEFIDFVGNTNVLTGHADVALFGMSDKNPTTRQERGHAQMTSLPYMHSFGVSENYVTLPRMPVKFSFSPYKPMSDAFQEIDISTPGPDNAFHVVPLSGGETIVRFLPVEDRLYYTHQVNSFETEDSVVLDLATLPANPFSGDLTSKSAVNKTLQDSCYHDKIPCLNHIRRFHIPLKHDGIVTSEIISDLAVSTDFTRMNKKMKGKKHCFYWGVEWFTDKKNHASMGISKYDLCSGGDVAQTKKTWSKKNWYPSEAVFVGNSKPGAAEDDGLMVFTALDGESGKTWLMAVDAATMEVHSQSGPFPRVAFTTHAEFYPADSTAEVYV